jgi:hypothetical protein
MFRRVSHFEWKQHEDVRLRVARLRAIGTGGDRGNRVSLSRALWRRPARTFGRVSGIRGLLRRIFHVGRRERG